MSRHTQHPTWRAAEASLGRPRAFQRAVSQLPPRQGLILRAMGALEDGRRDQVMSVADQARTAYPDLAAVLDLLVMPASSIDPTRIRKEARQAGIANPAALPMLDLLRSLAVARTDQATPPSRALRAAKKGRPALAAVVVALTSRAEQVQYEKRLRRWSPRAEQVVVTARACRAEWGVDDPWLKEVFDPVLLQLPRERWPDLYQDKQ
ncbi:MAG: hypothetical protein GXP62_08410, partial [Oligoflexia bacterium]|nr:hypothetical protein [Oligoflexia bacterium]